MIRIITLVLFTVQIVVVGGAFIWILGKFGFDPAQPYMSGIESMFASIWHGIKTALHL